MCLGLPIRGGTNVSAYLDITLTPEENFGRFYSGAVDVAPPTLPCKAEAERWDKVTRRLEGGMAFSLGAGFSLLALATGHRRYGLLFLPVAAGCWKVSQKTGEWAEGERMRAREEKRGAKGKQVNDRETIYKGMKDYLIKRRLEIEGEVIKAFNGQERKPSKPIIGISGYQSVAIPAYWRPEEEGKGLVQTYQKAGAPFIQMKQQFLQACEGSQKTPFHLEYGELYREWKALPDKPQFANTQVVAQLFAPKVSCVLEGTTWKIQRLPPL
ncbi:MAG: hypothetical protein AB7F31_01700 [Parachlamydiales bacterium]